MDQEWNPGEVEEKNQIREVSSHLGANGTLAKLLQEERATSTLCQSAPNQINKFLPKSREFLHYLLITVFKISLI